MARSAQFVGVISKIDWAWEHIEVLHTEVSAFEDSDRHTTRAERELDPLRYTYYVRFDPKPDPVRWGLLVGTAVHAMRSALDNLVYAMAVSVADDPPPMWDRLEFPIYTSGKRWSDKSVKLTSLTPAMRARVKEVQPFQGIGTGGAGAQRSPLWLIRELDNIDKHREIPVVGGLAAMRGPQLFTVGLGETTIEPYGFVDLLEEETPFAWITMEGKGDVENKPECRVTTHVVVGGTRIPLREALGWLFDWLTWYVHQFAEFTGIIAVTSPPDGP